MSKGVDIVMKISTFKHFTIDAAKSLKRNKTLSIASVITVAATLFILGIFMLVVQNVNVGIKGIGSKLEVEIYLKEEITMEEKVNIDKVLGKVEGVTNIDYFNKEAAFEKAKKLFGEQDSHLLEDYSPKNHPFPRSYVVRVEKPELTTKVENEVKNIPGVKKVRPPKKNIIDKFINFTNTIKLAGVFMFSILFFVSLFLIGNTIKLTVYSRKREIGIMKYVGATDWFIRWPFIIEGIIIGILGSLFSVVVLYYLYKIIYLKVSGSFMITNVIEPAYVYSSIMWKFVLGGAVMGSFGSVISIRKFLKV